MTRKEADRPLSFFRQLLIELQNLEDRYMSLSIISQIVNDIKKGLAGSGDEIKTGISIGNFIKGSGGGRLDGGIAKRAKESIAVFPMLCSDNLDPDQIFSLQKRLEGTIAEMLLLCVQNGMGLIDLSDPNAKRNFINEFTNGGNNLGDSVIGGVARRYTSDNMHENPVVFQSILKSTYHIMNNDLSADLDMSLLYNPTLSVEHDEIADECGVGSVAPASAPYSAAKKNDDYEVGNEAVIEHPRHEGARAWAATSERDATVENGRGDKDGKMSRKMAQIEKKADDAAPTIVSAEVLVKDATGRAGGKTTVAFGVKTSIHMLPSDQIAEAIKDTYAESSLLVRLIRWRAGELSFFKDVLLNIKEIKQSVRQSSGRNKNISPKDIFASLRFKTKNQNVVNLVEIEGGKFLPTAVLVTGLDEVEEVKRTCGKDYFRVMKDARELCHKLGLFGIVVVDSATNCYYSFFDDGSISYEKHSLKGKEKNDEDGIVRSIFGALRR